jgi:hypothetical protein
VETRVSTFFIGGEEMPRYKHNYSLKVFEQPFRSPITYKEIEANKKLKEIAIGKELSVISGNSVDHCKRKARDLIEKKLNRVVRSISVGPEGINAVVYAKDYKKSSKVYSDKKLNGVYR